MIVGGYELVLGYQDLSSKQLCEGYVFGWIKEIDFLYESDIQ